MSSSSSRAVDCGRAVGLPAEREAGSNNDDNKIPAGEFYEEFRGHRVEHLEKLLPRLLETSEAVLWLTGDSTLDNKYWFNETVPATPGAYEELLQPPRSRPDIAYWLNYLSAQQTQKYVANNDNNATKNSSATKGPVRWGALNTAVEESTLNERTFRLRPQDVFVRDNIRPNDVLIVSVSGNDFAMYPCPCTILAITSLALCLPSWCTERGCMYGTVPMDDCCCGCGPSLCSCACACPPCLGYFRHMLGTRMQFYIQALTAKTKPSKILVCMGYYLDEKPVSSSNPDGRGWADGTLWALGYNRHPEKLQTLIRKSYEEVLPTIRIPGSRVIPVPLFHVLDGKNSDDYVERVEPSVQGGRKLAEFLLACLEEDGKESDGQLQSTTTTTTTSLQNASSAAPPPPSSLFMGGRE